MSQVQRQDDGLVHEGIRDINYSNFDMSYSNILSCNMGEMIPIMNQEILPGDSIELKTDFLVRFSPLVQPLMHLIKVHTRFYFVPLRLIWDDFEKFITGDEQGDDTTTWPYIANPTVQEGELGDYLGLPVEVALGNISALPYRAYNLIYNEYFRNEDVQTVETISTGNGADATTNTTLLMVNWEEDYFTGCRPFASRIDTQVSLPLGTQAPLTGIGVNTGLTKTTGPLTVDETENAGTSYDYYTDFATATAGAKTYGKRDSSGNPLYYADLSSATAASIIQIREASALQLLYELLALGGSRYRKYLKNIFGVSSRDGRLDIPELLGGSSKNVSITEVLSTNDAAGSTQGTMSGHGICPGMADKIYSKFEEHGILMGIAFIMPRTMYQQGIHRKWFRDARIEYAHPQLALIGDQIVYDKEIYAGAASGTATFGYQNRYAEYKMNFSEVHGDFLSASDQTLETWHLGRDFGAEPNLNDTFVTASPDNARVFASVASDTIYCQFLHDFKMRRALPLMDATYQLI